MRILLTGGAGYIGSHVALALLAAKHEVFILDNHANSSPKSVEAIRGVSGSKVDAFVGDVSNKELLKFIFNENSIEAVVHLAGSKAVGESVENPLDYYQNNVAGSITLLQAMSECDVKKIIFSSSATVYGNPRYLPLDESHPTHPINPYGRTKLYTEEILRDLVNSDPSWSCVILRYFNPVGAHSSGQLGEEPTNFPNNLMPVMIRVVKRELDALKIFGVDYPTPDGTGLRDYIHVMDLAYGHLKALDFLRLNTGYEIFNLGIGKAVSVREMISSFEKAASIKIPVEISVRRKGDLAECYSTSKKASEILGWKPTFTLDDMCQSVWCWLNQKRES